MRNTFAVLTLVSVIALLVALSACSTSRSTDTTGDDDNGNTLTGQAGGYTIIGKIDKVTSTAGDAKRRCLKACIKSGLDSATCNERCKNG
ncbi:hypothetical protein HYS47_01285 [Candidatus Woesearchaeota archaeon]|nr:hypothetical protein [Candidatus Woesearchaeota archaeon]